LVGDIDALRDNIVVTTVIINVPDLITVSNTVSVLVLKLVLCEGTATDDRDVVNVVAAVTVAVAEFVTVLISKAVTVADFVIVAEAVTIADCITVADAVTVAEFVIVLDMMTVSVFFSASLGRIDVMMSSVSVTDTVCCCLSASALAFGTVKLISWLFTHCGSLSDRNAATITASPATSVTMSTYRQGRCQRLTSILRRYHGMCRVKG
jgi:hypothetical protein